MKGTSLGVAEAREKTFARVLDSRRRLDVQGSRYAPVHFRLAGAGRFLTTVRLDLLETGGFPSLSESLVSLLSGTTNPSRSSSSSSSNSSSSDERDRRELTEDSSVS